MPNKDATMDVTLKGGGEDGGGDGDFRSTVRRHAGMGECDPERRDDLESNDSSILTIVRESILSLVLLARSEDGECEASSLKLFLFSAISHTIISMYFTHCKHTYSKLRNLQNCCHVMRMRTRK